MLDKKSSKSEFLERFAIERLQDCGKLYVQGSDQYILHSVANFACRKHGVQKRNNGEPYYNHVLRVASPFAIEYSGNSFTVDVMVTAFLHDVIEDTGTTMQEVRSFLESVYPSSLNNESITKRIDSIMVALEHLTHIEGEQYFEYVMRLISLERSDGESYASGLAILVKLSDLKDNTSDLSGKGARRDKYCLTKFILKDKVPRLSYLYGVYEF